MKYKSPELCEVDESLFFRDFRSCLCGGGGRDPLLVQDPIRRWWVSRSVE